MHNALFGKLSLDAVYLAFDVDPRRAEGVTDAIRTLDLVGVNLTVPFKERVLPHLDHVTIAAEEAGAVNVVINVDGWLTGYNTDGEGLLGALAEEHGFNAKAQRCVVLGAGARAAPWPRPWPPPGPKRSPCSTETWPGGARRRAARRAPPRLFAPRRAAAPRLVRRERRGRRPRGELSGRRHRGPRRVLADRPLAIQRHLV
ncbi:MAG: hypothetical protein IPI35_27060 [Deltaproteobacteria bacterium]|nr:hypothetical protein [Deltaproteobacteria bacterium]